MVSDGAGQRNLLKARIERAAWRPEDRGSLYDRVEITISEAGAISGRVIQAFDRGAGASGSGTSSLVRRESQAEAGEQEHGGKHDTDRPLGEAHGELAADQDPGDGA